MSKTRKEINELHDFVIAGMMYSRGEFLGRKDNNIVLLFSPEEIRFVEKVNELFPWHSSVKRIPVKTGELISVTFPASYGKELKRKTNLTKEKLSKKILTDNILSGNDDQSMAFLDGLFSSSLSCEEPGLCFWRKKKYFLPDSSINFLGAVALLMERFEIEVDIENNSDKTFVAFGREFTKASKMFICHKSKEKFFYTIDIFDPNKKKLIP